MSDEEAKVNRREFVKFSAAASLGAGGLYAISMKTDVLAQENNNDPTGSSSDGHSYGYNGESV